MFGCYNRITCIEINLGVLLQNTPLEKVLEFSHNRDTILMSDDSISSLGRIDCANISLNSVLPNPRDSVEGLKSILQVALIRFSNKNFQLWFLAGFP